MTSCYGVNVCTQAVSLSQMSAGYALSLDSGSQTYRPAFFLVVFSIETSPTCYSYKVYFIISSAELRRHLSYCRSAINSIGVFEEFRDFISPSDESRYLVLKSNKFLCRSDSYWEGPRIDSPPKGQLS